MIPRLEQAFSCLQDRRGGPLSCRITELLYPWLGYLFSQQEDSANLFCSIYREMDGEKAEIAQDF
jgi:hypothetical protein